MIQKNRRSKRHYPHLKLYTFRGFFGLHYFERALSHIGESTNQVPKIYIYSDFVRDNKIIKYFGFSWKLQKKVVGLPWGLLSKWGPEITLLPPRDANVSITKINNDVLSNLQWRYCYSHHLEALLRIEKKICLAAFFNYHQMTII